MPRVLPGVLLAGAGLLALAALLAAAPAGASSYGGSGNWTIGAATDEVDAGETITVSGNLTVAGTLTLVNSTVTLDRNATVTGSLKLLNSSLTFTVDGPGTNFLGVGPLARFSLLDNDGNASTPGDGSLLAADAYGFNATFDAAAYLNISNSRVVRAGWANATVVRAGFYLGYADVNVTGSTFLGGTEVFSVYGQATSGPAGFYNSTFDGAVSGINMSGHASDHFIGLRFLNYTFGLRMWAAYDETVDGIVASAPLIVGFDPPLAPPPGTAVSCERCVNFRVANVTVTGTPGSVAPRSLLGVVIRNSTGVEVRTLVGTWGETVGQFFNTSNVLMDSVSASSFSGPLSFLACTNVTLLNFTGVGEGSGVQAVSTSGLLVQRLTADNLLVPALTAAGGTGSFVMRDSVVTNSLGGVDLGGNLAAPLLSNLTLTNLSFGLQLSIPDPTGARFEAFWVRQVLRNVMDLTFGNGTSLAVADWDVDDVQGMAINLTGTRASYFSFIRLRFNATDGDVLRLNVSSIDNLSVSVVQANLHLSALVHLETESASEVYLANLVSTNSSGVLGLFNGGALDRIDAYNISLTAGDQPPAFGPPASFIFDTTGQEGAHGAGPLTSASVRVFRVNTSNRGAVYVEAGFAGSLHADNLTLDSLQLDGVRVLAGNGVFTADLAQIFYNGTGAAAVRLEGVQGGTVDRLDVTAATAIQLENAWHVRAYNVNHSGSYAGLLVHGGGDIAVYTMAAQGSFAVDASLCAGLTLRLVAAQATGWAVRASSCSQLDIDGLVAGPSTNGVSFTGASGATLANVVLDVIGDGLQIGPGATDVDIQAVSVTTPTGTTSGKALQVSYSSRVRVADFTFTGRCQQALDVVSTDALDIDNFSASVCGVGMDIATVRFLNLTRFTVAGAFNGSALIIGNSQDLLVSQGNLTGARAGGVMLSAINRARIVALDVGGAGGDGVWLAYASNTTVDGLNLDGAAGACMRVLYSSRNVTLSNIRASRGLGGIEVLSSSNLTLVNIVASENGGSGIYTDLLSYDVTLRNITAARNLWNGVQVSLNGTHLIDGNFTDNGDPGIGGAPGVRVDWRIEGSASLTDEVMDLTGDLLLGPGASLAVTRTNITVEQTARRRALLPYTTIVLQAGASITLDHAAIAPRDSRVPYSVTVETGSRIVLSSASITGGSTADSTSSVNLTGAQVFAVDATFAGWFRPLAMNGGSLDCNGCVFANNRRGPLLVQVSASLRTFYARDNDLDGLEVQGGPLLTIDGASFQYNHAMGARIQDVAYLQLISVEGFSNDAGGLEVLRSNVTGHHVCFNATAGTGVRVAGGSSVSLDVVCGVDNAGAGASFEDLGSVELTNLDMTGNHGSGLQLLRVASANVSGGTIAGSSLYGLYVLDGGFARIEGVDFAGDEGGALRAEGSARVSIGNATVSTTADYALTLFGASRGLFTDLVLSAILSGVLAAQSSEATLLNCTANSPTVVDDAVVTVAWYMRVLVQGADGYPAVGANVTVWNASGAEVARAATLQGGSTPLIAVDERQVRANGVQEAFGPEGVQAAHAQLGRAVGSVNVSRYTAFGLKLDNVTPAIEVTLEGEQGLSGWYLSAVELSLRATDDRVAGVRLFWRIGGGPWRGAEGDAGTAATTLSVESEGINRVEYFAVDAAGNEAPVSTVLVRVDAEAPTARFVALNATEYRAVLPLAWSGADGGGSGVDHFEIEYSFNGSAPQKWRPQTTLTAEAFPAQDGSYKFTLVAYDAAGRASEPVSMALRVALLGTLRIRVVDVAGNLVSNLTVVVSGLEGPVTGSGIVVIQGVPPGSHNVSVSAPGFETKAFDVVVTAGQTTDLGDQVLSPSAPFRGDFSLAFAYMALGALAVMALAYYVRMKQKWERRRKEREAEAEAQRKADRLKRRR